MDSPDKGLVMWEKFSCHGVLMTRQSQYIWWVNNMAIDDITTQRMMTSSNENFFRIAGRAGNSPVTGELPAQRPVAWSSDVFFDLRLNKRLSTQTWGWWYETPSRSLWRHCTGLLPDWQHKEKDVSRHAIDNVLQGICLCTHERGYIWLAYIT